MATEHLRYKITGDARGLKQAANVAAAAIAAIGTAAIKSAADIDRSFTKIITLVGVSEKAVNSMEVSVKRLARTTGISAKEAADALFFITSAGFRGSEAIDILESSLKGAAIGLGETKFVADATTSAINAYGIENLSAAEATDVLTAAVRLGKLEAGSFAQQIGQVIPIASTLGVSYNEVAGALASLSRTGTDVATGTTQIKRVLASLLGTTPQAERAFNELGLSSEGLRKQIREEGLLSVLGTLKTSFEGNANAAAKAFPNIRALLPVLDLTGKNSKVTADIMTQMNSVLGETERGFFKLSGRASFKLDRAINNVKTSFSEMGKQLLTAMLPTIQKISGAISALLGWFSGLDGVTQAVIISVGVLIVSLPLLIPIISGIGTALTLLTGPVGLVIAGLAAIAYIVYKNWNEVLPVIVGFTNKLIDVYNNSLLVRLGVNLIIAQFKNLFVVAKAAIDFILTGFKGIWDVIKAIATGGDIAGAFKKAIEDLDVIFKGAGKEMGDNFTEAYEKALDGQLEYITAEGINVSLSKLSKRFQDFYKNLFPPASGGGGPDNPDKTTPPPLLTPDFGPSLSKWEKYKNSLKSILTQIEEPLKAFFNDGGAAILTSGFSAIGDAIANGSNILKAAGNAILATLGNFLSQLGAEAIKLGVLAIGFGKAIAAIKKWIIANPIAAIAGGIALVTIGSLFSTAANKSQASISGGGGTGTAGTAPTSSSVPQFEQSRGSGGGLVGKIRGQDIVLGLQNAGDSRNGLTGTSLSFGG
ncbi:MAG: phage tail tape measure protein [Gammaproteobacteria bacterium]|nr:phage tail tape measure protein [Gammaproteobacteria bacterium]